MLVVIDTNAFVSAAAGPRGRLGRLLDHLESGVYDLLYSADLLAELREVLDRPRVRRGLSIRDEDVATLLALIHRRGVFVVPSRVITACRDPDDNRLLEVAVEGRADIIVTGDEGLLILHSFESIPIVRPAEFLRMLEEHASQG